MKVITEFFGERIFNRIDGFVFLFSGVFIGLNMPWSAAGTLVIGLIISLLLEALND